MTDFKDEDNSIEQQCSLKVAKPNYNISFHKEGMQIGCLDFNGPKMVFIGDADESVKVFIEAFNGWFEQRLAEERKSCMKASDL